MRKTLVLAFIFIGGMETYAQLQPTGSCLSTPSLSGAGSSRAWLRGGNQAAGPGGNDNRFGTCYNSPIYTITNDAYRMKLNGNVSYNINGFTQTRNGYLLLGQPGSNTIGPLYQSPLSPNNGAFSLFHLNGPGTFVQTGGFRDWMQTGITYTSNNDLSYIGHRQVGALDRTETVIAWSDNASGPAGKDVMSFRFTAGAGSIASETANIPDLNGVDNDGREIIRMMGTGNVGIGPRFNQQIDPQSNLHQHQENAASSWHQISNQFLGSGGSVNNGPTGILASDGLRLGIFGSTNALQNGIGMLYNQELQPLLLSTNANTTTTTATATRERVRIMSYNTPTALGGIGYGPYTPYASVNGNFTRMSISHNPNSPLTRPLSLLHLGYNNDLFGITFGHLFHHRAYDEGIPFCQDIVSGGETDDIAGDNAGKFNDLICDAGNFC